MPELRLRPYHEVRGAVFREQGGWEVPASYASLDTEVTAVRRSAGMIDFSDRAKIRVTGPDRVSFVDGLVTCDVKVLTPGTSAYGLILTEKSRVIGDVRVYALEDAFVIDTEASQKDMLLAHFRRHVVSDDVVFEDLGVCAHLEVHGPRSSDFVSRAIGMDVRGLARDAFVAFPVGRRHAGYATRIRTVGEVGFALWSPHADLASVWAFLDRAGVPPVGRDAFEVLRIEAGVPRVGVDMTEETLALEVAPDGAISFTKGCYLGQEVVARGTYIGHMNRKLVGLQVDGDVPPSYGDRVATDEEDVGMVTSSAWSPTLGRIIALGLLRLSSVRKDSPLFIDHAGWNLRARIHPLPFVRGSA